MRAARGFTLFELMVALAILGVILAIAVPSLSSARASVEAAGARAALYEELIRATRAASLDRQQVVVCSSADGRLCSRQAAWEHGWIAFIDRDRDRVPDDGRLLNRQLPFADGLFVRSTAGRTRLVFLPHGGAAAGSNVTFTVCDARGREHAATVVVANSGRIRSGKPKPGSAVSCP
jgi:type IV fimbrial biogenesis protein FimT